MVIADVVEILASDSLEGNLYLFDDNKANGSVGHGTDQLTTRLIFDPNEEITLLWNITSIEPESFADISQIIADKKYLEITKSNYEGSDIIYWTGVIKKPFEQLPYNLSIRVGNRNMEFSFNLNLIGDLKSK